MNTSYIYLFIEDLQSAIILSFLASVSVEVGDMTISAAVLFECTTTGDYSILQRKSLDVFTEACLSTPVSRVPRRESYLLAIGIDVAAIYCHSACAVVAPVFVVICAAGMRIP